jgi:hypothetical protein
MIRVSTEIETKLTDCNAVACAYNHSGTCRAIAVTIETPVPQCGTFIHTGTKAGFPATNAIVGACKASSCLFNNGMECEAEEIQMMLRNNQPVCAAFQN